MNTSNLTVKVSRKWTEAANVCAFELVNAEQGKPLPAFSAGSHIDVHISDALTRQYSLCNDPLDSHRYLIGVLKDPATRGGSKAMHDLVKEGDLLEISTPKNHFPLAHEASKSVLFAGGIGVTPILCMAERLAIAGAKFEMHYCTRSRESTAFHGRISKAAFAANVQFHFDDGAPEQKLDMATALAMPAAGTHLYVCGPKGFMDFVLAMARAARWPEEQLHYEFFSAEVAKFDSDSSFEVKLASSGRIVLVPKGRTVIEALAAAGVEVPVSCEQGVCGTCLTRVLEGTPDHRDLFMTPDEQSRNDQFTPCCSRSKSPMLMLDL